MGMVNSTMFPAPPPSYAEGDLPLVWAEQCPIAVRPARFLEQIPTESAVAVVLFFHGNGSDIGLIDPLIQQFATGTGYPVFSCEYPGYGLHGGKPSPKGALHAAELAYRCIKVYAPNSSVLLVGQSIGSGVACEFARKLTEQGDPPRGLVLISPFTSIYAMADHLIDFFIQDPPPEEGDSSSSTGGSTSSSSSHSRGREMPSLERSEDDPPPGLWTRFKRSAARTGAKVVVSSVFTSDQHIQHVSCPTLIFHGERDTLIPISMAQQLFRTSPSPSKLFFAQPRSTHNMIDWRQIIREIKTNIPSN
eukprot:m.360830 g.360830  ORF g.360830 m.360830 type:complete len:305 (+) comp19189_c0_seq1:236-1150(+)